MKRFWDKEAQAAAVTLAAACAMGLVAGILFANLTYPWRDGGTEVLGVYLLERLEEGVTPSTDYFFYILRLRGGNVLFFFLAGMTAAARGAALLGAGGLGFLAGAAASMAVLQTGIRGMLLFGAANFPQCLFYIPGMLGVLILAYRRNGRIRGARPGALREYLLTGFLLFLCLLAGIALEAYGNPGFLEWIYSRM